MSKPSDDLSALFRSLRPDESAFRENTSSGVRDAEQRWPLFKAVAPQKPQDAPALSEHERQRWTSQEKSPAGTRKPALSLPALSDKMSKGLGKISEQASRNIATVKPATRWESQEQLVEGAARHPLLQQPERPRTMLAEPAPVPVPLANEFAKNEPLKNGSAIRTPTAVKVLSEVADAGSRNGLDLFNKKPAPTAPALVSVQMPKTSEISETSKISETPERDLPATRRNDESLKSIFSRLEARPEAKPEVEVKPIIKRSSFLDRLGKR